MSTRLQVVMSEEELDEIRAAAERHRTTVSEWVRGVLRAERTRERSGGSTRTVREPAPRYGAAEEAPASTGRIRLEIEVREDLLEAVRSRFHLASGRAAIELALRRLAVTPMSREEALAMQGAGWEGDLDELRSGDPGEPW
jgi:Arc/MetJ family transcription regulator